VTRDFLVFPVCPVTVSMARARAGRPPVAWEPGRQSRVAVLNRHHPHEVRWFTCEPCFVWHVVNGWNDGDAITLDVCQQAEPAFPHEDGSPTEPSAQAQHLTRWELDWSCSHEVARRALCEDVCEYPRFDERFGTTRLGHSYFCCHGGPGTSDPFHRGIGHFDHAHERMETFRFGATCAVSEPVFVPRTPRAGEGDGFLLCIVYQEESDRSHLAVLDALHVDRGPIARAVLRHRVPMGFHGCWLQR
jgi:carotenoid cleavage dioxygenase